MDKNTLDLERIGQIAVEAGKAILAIYENDFSIDYKKDKSPLTEADSRSHEVIAQRLGEYCPDIPVLSEEGREIPFEERSAWESLWLVDPLDGTKEFIKKNGEFTVNIALIEKGLPVLGVIYVPVSDELYLADVDKGCTRIASGKRSEIRVSAKKESDPIRIVQSRSHPSEALSSFLEKLPGHETIHRGSSLKFCAVAEGKADLYPRFGPTWEWDTAAGQAVLTAAGGCVIDLHGNPFRYNRENILNGFFIAASSMDYLRFLKK